jgi:molybdenum cofactor cytidylyltransferase
VITGVVLAAGEGRRFGGTKQLVEVRGRALVLHAVEALREAGIAEVIVVTGHDAGAVEVALPDDVRTVRNDRYREGQSTSLAAALHVIAEGSEGAVILQADQPGVTAQDVRDLVTTFTATRARIVRIRYLDAPGPALLSREVFAEAGHLHGDVGARVLMASHPDWVEDVAVDRSAPIDVDVPGDLDQV